MPVPYQDGPNFSGFDTVILTVCSPFFGIASPNLRQMSFWPGVANGARAELEKAFDYA